MSYHGLRAFLARLDAAGELARVTRPVALDQELGAVCVTSLRAQGPALLFERPGSSDIPVLVNLLATRRRFALALDCEPEAIEHEWNRRAASPVPPRLVADGPCQEIVSVGPDVDLGRLPVPTWNALDGGPYLTLSCHVTVDPGSGSRNVGIYRNQVHDRSTLGVVAGPFAQLLLGHRVQASPRFPVAIAIGADPRVVMAAAAPFPAGTDELAMAGALAGQALDVVRCHTVPLEVPADSELIIEGEVRLDELREEGPYGEISGYYGLGHAPRPTIRVTAITHRATPLLHLAYQGAPPHETDVLAGVGRAAEILRTVEGIGTAHVTEGGCGLFHAVVGVGEPHAGDGLAVGRAVLASQVGRYVKQVIVVDGDVDPFDALEVEWAVATRVQPARDTAILPDEPGVIVDPSRPRTGDGSSPRTSKLIIDATRKGASFPAVSLPSAAALATVRANWRSYGIAAGPSTDGRGNDDRD